MNAISIEAAFRDWWEESYKRPPAPHAVMTHVAFAEHMLQVIELPAEYQAFDYTTISDATLNQWICDHLRYTAREGGDSLRADANAAVAALDARLAAGFDPFHHPAPQ